MELVKSNLVSDLERWSKFYFDYLSGKDYSKQTISLYNTAISFFIEYIRELDDKISLKDIKTSHFTSYLIYLDKNTKIKNKLSYSSKQTYLKGVFGLFNFISNENDDFFNYDRIIAGARLRKKTHKENKIDYLNEHEYDKLISG